MDDAELDFGAITIDTCILLSAGYKFNEGLLKQMEQFARSPVQVVQTDIVHKEAMKHIADGINKSRISIKQALKSATKYLRIPEATVETARGLLAVPGGDLEVAEERLQRYYAQIGAKVLESDKYVDLSRLMKMYFETEKPFEERKDKKNEFPDAIALISLERWAEVNDINLIAVSLDKGWKTFAEKSNRITVIGNLAEAIAKFQPHNKVNSIIETIRENALFDDENYLLTEIEKAIIGTLGEVDIDIEATSSFSYEESAVFADYMSHTLAVDDQGLIIINVVSIKEKTVVLQVNADVTCEIAASFDFSAWDSIDREYVRIGSSTCTVEETYNTDILISLTGDFGKRVEELEIKKIEILEVIDHANFDEVEPDWRDLEEE